ncbi:PUB domain-containing protein [Besnoitia besnoiti]|uniref:PUB domain-containing protein n=1 Tax=Besnoitia besnoiti TaxID=94643 RepID=A0A2A9M6A3_BESBE|nr:PUB domain-containing protein [Besnoitia besnoiti]PFH31841.1 PUB domain-containing protein [Besnoitia besnoiti]
MEEANSKEKCEVESLLLEIGEELGRSEVQMQPFVDKLVRDNWLETAESLRSLSAAQWTQLQLPLRLEELLKRRIRSAEEGPSIASSSPSPSPSAPPSASPSFSAASAAPTPVSVVARAPAAEVKSGAEAAKDPNVFEEADFAVVYAAVTDETLFPFSLTEAIERLQLEVPREALAGVLRTLFTVIDGVLAQPSNPKKRRLRKANATFHNQVGRHRAAVQVMEAAGFCEGKMRDPASGALEDFYVMDTAYVMRLTDAHHLLSQLAPHAGVEAPPLPSAGFNPYSSSIVSASGTSYRQIAGKHADQRLVESSKLKEKIKEREQLLQTGGGEEVPLAPAVYALEELRARERAEKAELLRANATRFEEELAAANADKPSLTAADIARIKEIMGDGPSFKSRMRQQLEQLEKRKVFKSCTVRVLLPDRVILQLKFAPHQTLKLVRHHIQQFLHPQLRSAETPFGRWFLCETPPLRKVDLKKTLYEEGFVPNCTLHLKFPDECPPFPLPCLDPEALAQHNLRAPSFSLASSCAAFFASAASSGSASSSSAASPSSPSAAGARATRLEGAGAATSARAPRSPLAAGSAARSQEPVYVLPAQDGQLQPRRLSSASSTSSASSSQAPPSSPSSSGDAQRPRGLEVDALTKKTSIVRNIFRKK